jgi:N-acetylglutamate synthase-like GNAT family acetyltransferase
VTDSFHIRPARTSDVSAIKKLVAPLAEQRILMAKETVAYYESLQEFRIAESDGGDIIGCGALHVMWEDLAEVRTLATSEDWRGKGVGHVLVESLLEEARALGVARVFCLTFGRIPGPCQGQTEHARQHPHDQVPLTKPRGQPDLKRLLQFRCASYPMTL